MVQTSKDGHLEEEPMAQPYLIEDFLALTYQRTVFLLTNQKKQGITMVVRRN